eukprot:9209815-Lingulodinium_polyedra.AAC.1
MAVLVAPTRLAIGWRHDNDHPPPLSDGRGRRPSPILRQTPPSNTMPRNAEIRPPHNKTAA